MNTWQISIQIDILNFWCLFTLFSWYYKLKYSFGLANYWWVWMKYLKNLLLKSRQEWMKSEEQLSWNQLLVHAKNYNVSLSGHVSLLIGCSIWTKGALISWKISNASLAKDLPLHDSDGYACHFFLSSRYSSQTGQHKRRVLRCFQVARLPKILEASNSVRVSKRKRTQRRRKFLFVLDKIRGTEYNTLKDQFVRHTLVPKTKQNKAKLWFSSWNIDQLWATVHSLKNYWPLDIFSDI